MRNRAGSADAIAGRNFEIAGVDTLRVLVYPGPRVHIQRPVDVGARIHPFQHEAKPEAAQDPDQARRRKCGEPRIRDRLGQSNIEVLSKPRRDLVLEELSQTAMLRVYAAQQLTFVETESKSVICLSRPGLPCRLLSRHDHSQAIEVGDGASVYGFVEREQACLVGQELADGDSL